MSKLIAYCFVSMDNKNNDKQGNVSVNDVDVDVCNSRDILAKLVEKRCKPDWTFFSKLYAKGRLLPRSLEQVRDADIYSILLNLLNSTQLAKYLTRNQTTDG